MCIYMYKARSSAMEGMSLNLHNMNLHNESACYRFEFESVTQMFCITSLNRAPRRGGGLGSSTIFKKFNEPYAPS